MLWQYVEDESNEIVLTMMRNVEDDGYDRVSPGASGAETIVLKVLSAALLKMLALATERVGTTDLAGAYMEMVPMHVELIKVYTFRALEREIGSKGTY